MLHQILTTVDKNCQKEAFEVIVNLVDWSQAFDSQSQTIGRKSFIKKWYPFKSYTHTHIFLQKSENENQMKQRVQLYPHNKWWVASGWAIGHLRIIVSNKSQSRLP